MVAAANYLLLVHIAAGFVALGTSFLAVTNKVFDLSHRWHVAAGRGFAWSMVIMTLSAVALSILGANVFLLLIAVFSLYLVLSGWAYARNRSGVPGALDRVRAMGMVLASIAMLALGTYLLITRDLDGVTMLAFGGIGAALSLSDLRILRAGGLRGSARIGKHLTMMLASSIAAITAFLVVNITFHPMVVVWLAPTLVLVPVIIAMNRKVRKAPAGRATGAA